MKAIFLKYSICYIDHRPHGNLNWLFFIITDTINFLMGTYPNNKSKQMPVIGIPSLPSLLINQLLRTVNIQSTHVLSAGGTK